MAAAAKSVRQQRQGYRAKVLRELEKSIASARTKKAKEYRAEVGSAKKGKRERLGDAKQRCAANTKKARAEGRQEYREALERHREIDKAEREAFRAEMKRKRIARKEARLSAKEAKIKAALAQCQKERKEIEEEAGALIAERETKLKAQLEDIRVYREVDRRNASMKRGQRAHQASAKERREESDDEVLHNIDRSLHPLFHRVKSIIRGTPFMSRTEAFQQYVHDHPDEAIPRWEATYTDDYFAREYAKHLAQQGEAPQLPGHAPGSQPEPAPEPVRKAARKKGAGRKRTPKEAPSAPASAAVSPGAIRALSTPGPSAPAAEEIISIRGVPAERMGLPKSPDLDDLIERVSIQGAAWMGWRVGDLEVIRTNGHVFIALPGAEVVKVPIPAGMPIRTVVERWLDEERPARPFARERAPEPAPARALPAVAAAEEPPAGAEVEERNGLVRVLFADKPRVELRERLKRAGFRWNAPAWEARATEEARAAAVEVTRDAAAPAPAMSSYEAKRLARVERMKTRAEREKQEAHEKIERARKMAALIPPGEPIHVGHHSEQRDRNYRKKIQHIEGQGFRQLQHAEKLESRAERAEHNAAISSDDPEAIPKLEAKLEELDRVRDLLPRAREILKKTSNPAAARPALLALGLSEGDVQRLTPGAPLQRYAVKTVKQNLDGEIQRVRRRIADLKERAAKGPRRPETFGDARVVEEENRVRIFFPGKPDDVLRKALRARGFLWAPSVGAWQRKASEGAWFWARQILRERTPAQSAARAAAPPVPEPAPEPERWEEEPPPGAYGDEPPPEAFADDEPLEEEPAPAARITSATQTYSGTSWSPARQVGMFGAPAPTPASPAAALLLTPSEPEPRRAPAAPRPTAEPQGPRRNLAFEDLKPSEMSAWERTPSLFGASGPVPPPQPGEQRAPKQKRLPF